MLINNDEQYCAIWDRVYNELGFKPSCDYRGHSLRVPLPFKLEEPYVVYGFDDMTDDQIDLVTETMKKSLIEITHVGECMYALDWHHEAFLYDPRRVLKEGGKFYSATYGENGIMPYLCSLLEKYDIKQNMNLRFTCQNGEEQLSQSFEDVEFVRYEDSLEVTDIDDLIIYMYSLVCMQEIQDTPKDEVKKILENYMVDGVLSIPKDYGMFISK